MTASDPIIYGQTPSPGTVDPCTIIKEGEAIGIAKSRCACRQPTSRPFR